MIKVGEWQIGDRATTPTGEAIIIKCFVWNKTLQIWTVKDGIRGWNLDSLKK